MELKTKRVEVYYERIQKLAHGLQVPTTYRFFTIMFRANLQSYLRIVITRMKWLTLQQHKEKQGMHFQYHRIPNRQH